MKKTLISLIVPVYNGAAFLAGCIESVQRQSYSYWELLLIDDGSTDNSLALCKQYALQDKRIHVFSQKNQGNCVARNTGIKHAKGDLIGFLDQDDQVKPETFQILLDLHHQTKAEIVWGSVINFFENKKSYNPIPKFTHVVDYEHLSLEDMLSTTEFWCWNKLYARRLFAKGLRFNIKLALGEDIDFIFHAAQLANFLAFTPTPVYVHLVRPSSVSHRPQIRQYLNAYSVWQKIYSFVIKQKLQRVERPIYRVLVHNQADILLVILLYDIQNKYLDVFYKTRYNFNKNIKSFFSDNSIPFTAKIALFFPWVSPTLALFVFRLPFLHAYLCSCYEKRISQRC